MSTSVFDSLLWGASLLNAALVAHQWHTLRQTRSAEGLSLVMMGGFLFMQVIYTLHGLQTKNWAMVAGMGASAIFNLGVIASVMEFRRLAQLSREMHSMLNSLELAFENRRSISELDLVNSGISPAELTGLVDDGFLVRYQIAGSFGYRFASEAFRKEIVARRWRD